MNKLQKMLVSSSKEIRGVRAKLLNDSMKRAQERLVMDLEEEYDTMTEKFKSVCDVYPNSGITLRIVSKDFDPKKWVADNQKLKVDLLMKKVELDYQKELAGKNPNWSGEQVNSTARRLMEKDFGLR